ncbi:MAG TPA: hypothetical protein VLA54_03460 [Acidimicrobiia bacterium]|nr:hypothetical protein [Acidimicrobiia bacterium]
MVQSRLSMLMGSRQRGLLVASLLFGFLHLPVLLLRLRADAR